MGSEMCIRDRSSKANEGYLKKSEEDEPTQAAGITGLYASMLGFAVRIPGTVFVLSVLTLVGIVSAYGRWGAGVEFFVSLTLCKRKSKYLQEEISRRPNYETLCWMLKVA